MKKLIGFLIVLFVLVIGTAVFVYTNGARVLSSILSTALNTQVTVGSISFDGNTILIRDIKVKNPPGSDAEYAFTVDAVDLEASLATYLRRTINIHKVLIGNVYMSIECYDALCSKTNWDSIIGNTDTSTSNSEQKIESERRVKIHYLSMENLSLEIHSKGKDPQNINVKGPIVVKDIDTSKGIPIKVITNIILHQAFNQALKHMADVGLKMFKTPISPLENILNSK